MRKAFVVVLLALVVAGVGLVAAAAVLSAQWREEFAAFDAWEATGARVAEGLEEGLGEGPGQPFKCTSKPISEDPGKAFVGALDFAASMRPANGVVLPFADEPKVLYFGPNGLSARRSTIEVFRESAVGTWAALRAVLAAPVLLTELRSPPPRLQVPLMSRDVDVTVLVRSVRTPGDKLVLLLADLVVATPKQIHCQGELVITLGATSDPEDTQLRQLSKMVQHLIQGAPPTSPEPEPDDGEVNQR